MVKPESGKKTILPNLKMVKKKLNRRQRLRNKKIKMQSKNKFDSYNTNASNHLKTEEKINKTETDKESHPSSSVSFEKRLSPPKEEKAKKKFKVRCNVNSSEDFSANWKQLKDVSKLNQRQRLRNKKIKMQSKNKFDSCNTNASHHLKTEEKIKKTEIDKESHPSSSVSFEKSLSPPKEENGKKKFKVRCYVNSSEDFSANWKQLKEMIADQGEQRKKKLKPKSAPNKEKHATGNEPTTKSGEVWFDDVDPVLLESSKRPLKSCSIHHSSSSKETLEKQNSFSGPTKALGLDCEMVGGGLSGEVDILARVSLVNQYGHALYDKYVQPGEPVKDYRTYVSGIRPENLVNGEAFHTVQKEVCELIKGRIVVGHALSNDFRCLLLSHPRHKIRDTSRFKPFRKLVGGAIPSLRRLADKVLGIQIQTGEHCSVQDAQAAMRLYTLNRREWEKKANRKGRYLDKKLRKHLATAKQPNLAEVEEDKSFLQPCDKK